MQQSGSYSADICVSQWHSTMSSQMMYRNKWKLTPLWHILFSSRCEIIRSNDSDGLIWWLLSALSWWTAVSFMDSWSRCDVSVLWLWFCSDAVCMFALDGFPVASEKLSDVFRVTNCSRCRTKKESVHAFGRTAGRGCLVPCLRYRLYNLVPVVWHRQMNCIQMCLGL